MKGLTLKRPATPTDKNSCIPIGVGRAGSCFGYARRGVRTWLAIYMTFASLAGPGFCTCTFASPTLAKTTTTTERPAESRKCNCRQHRRQPVDRPAEPTEPVPHSNPFCPNSEHDLALHGSNSTPDKSLLDGSFAGVLIALWLLPTALVAFQPLGMSHWTDQEGCGFRASRTMLRAFHLFRC